MKALDGKKMGVFGCGSAPCVVLLFSCWRNANLARLDELVHLNSLRTPYLFQFSALLFFCWHHFLISCEVTSGISFLEGFLS